MIWLHHIGSWIGLKITSEGETAIKREERWELASQMEKKCLEIRCMIEDVRIVIKITILAHIPMDFKGSFPHVRTAGSDILSVLVSFSICLLQVLSGELFSPYGTCETYLKPLVMFSSLPTWLDISYTFLKSATAGQSLICTLMWENKSSFIEHF